MQNGKQNYKDRSCSARSNRDEPNGSCRRANVATMKVSGAITTTILGIESEDATQPMEARTMPTEATANSRSCNTIN